MTSKTDAELAAELKIQAAELLESAGTVLLIPEWHTKGEFARNENFSPTNIFAADACKFCAVGAVTAAAGKGWESDEKWQVGKIAEIAVDMKLGSVGFTDSIASFNDSPETTNEDVASLFFDAADALRAEATMYSTLSTGEAA